MRIVLLSPEYPPSPRLGGIGTNTATVAPALVRLGLRVCVVTRGETPSVGEFDGVRVVRLVPRWFPERRVERLIANRAFAVAAHAFGPDVIQAPEWEATGWWVARRMRVPLVTRLATPTYVLDELNHGAVRRQTAFVRRLERDQTRRSAAVLAPTRALADRVASDWSLAPAAIRVVPNPVALDEVRRLGEQPAHDELPASYIAFVGRLERRKGVPELGKALAAVLPRHPELDAVLVGRDAGESGGAVMEQFTADVAEVRERVHLLGELPRERLLPILRRARIVVLPSRWENFANVALEALALGRPLIATRVGGFVEFLEHDVNGWLIPAADAKALAAELDRRLGSPESLERVGAGARSSAERFHVDRIAAELAALYEEVAAIRLPFSSEIYRRGYRTFFRPEADDDPFRRHYAAKRQAIFRTFDSDPRIRILDVGGGYGRITGALAARHEVTLCDISDEMLDEARNRWPRLDVVRGDARALPFDEESFDAVLAIDLLPHVPDLDEALAELARVCRPAGRVVFDTTNRSPWWVLGFPSYVNWRPRRLLLTMIAGGVLPEWRTLIRHHRPAEVRTAAARAGLQIERVDRFGPAWTPKWHLWWATRT